jgi:hypothetical protein
MSPDPTSAHLKRLLGGGEDACRRAQESARSRARAAGSEVQLVRGHGVTGRAIGLVLLSRPRQQKMSSAMEPLTTQ